MLKQEKALAELDAAIDGWASKLEHAESRRSLIRQKLLESLAATLLLRATSDCPLEQSDTQTPPQTPEKWKAPGLFERNDVESIKIYADSDMYALLANIDQEICVMADTDEEAYPELGPGVVDSTETLPLMIGTFI